MEFSKRLDLFGDEIFAALNERKVALEAQGRTIYNLSVGTPDFAPAVPRTSDVPAEPVTPPYSARVITSAIMGMLTSTLSRLRV